VYISVHSVDFDTVEIKIKHITVVLRNTDISEVHALSNSVTFTSEQFSFSIITTTVFDIDMLSVIVYLLTSVNTICKHERAERKIKK